MQFQASPSPSHDGTGKRSGTPENPVFRQSARLYQTDGWEGYDEKAVEATLTKPKVPKSWHVPDEEIKALVREMGTREGIDESLLQHAKCRQPRAFEAEEEEELTPDMVTTVKLEEDAPGRSKHNRSVHFEGDAHEDAIDMMLKSTMSLREARREAREAREKEQADQHGEEEEYVRDPHDWKISDEALEELVMKMASSQPGLSSSAPPALSKSASAPTLGSTPVVQRRKQQEKEADHHPDLLRRSRKSKDGKIAVNIYFLDSQDTMTIRLYPDLRIGLAQPPKGNRFTDIYGLGASTKGFSEIKKFDHQRRRWSENPERRPDWKPEWCESLKGVIEHITGTEIVRQKLFYKKVEMFSGHMTLRSWGIREGDTIQVQVRRRVPLEELEDVRKVSKAAKVAAGTLSRSQSESFSHSESVKSLPARLDESETSDLYHPRDLERSLNASSSSPSKSPKKPKGSINRTVLSGTESVNLRNNRMLRSCTSKGDIWMMPHWMANPAPGYFAAPGDPFITVANQAPTDWVGDCIYLKDASDPNLSRVREAVTGFAAYTTPGRA